MRRILMFIAVFFMFMVSVQATECTGAWCDYYTYKDTPKSEYTSTLANTVRDKAEEAMKSGSKSAYALYAVAGTMYQSLEYYEEAGECFEEAGKSAENNNVKSERFFIAATNSYMSGLELLAREKKIQDKKEFNELLAKTQTMAKAHGVPISDHRFNYLKTLSRQ